MTPALGGYRTNLTEAATQRCAEIPGEGWDWDDCERRRKVYDYYGTPWIEH